jgi:hypothetical protein
MHRPPHLPSRPRRALLLSATALGWHAAWAQAPAAAPIRLIVPFTPGTGIDLIARQIGPHLAERLGRPVVVDNRAGASGNLGTEAVVRAPADGSTLLVTVNTMVMNRALYPKLGFDPLKDLDPVSLTSWGQLLLVASKASGIQNAPELLARAKAKPRRAELRLARQRHAAPPGDGTAEEPEPHLHHPHPVPRHRPGGDRPAGRPDRRDVPAHPRGAAARQDRQPAGPGHQQRQGRTRCCPRCRRCAR